MGKAKMKPNLYVVNKPMINKQQYNQTWELSERLKIEIV